MAQLLASDLDPSKRNDGFMGKGFEAMMKKAYEEGCELVIGKFCDNTEWRIE